MWLIWYSVGPARCWGRFSSTVRQGIFLPEPTFSVDSLMCVRIPLCAITCINICVHITDPVVHVRVQWIMETLKHPACTVGLGSATLLLLAVPGDSNQNFLRVYWFTVCATASVCVWFVCWGGGGGGPLTIFFIFHSELIDFINPQRLFKVSHLSWSCILLCNKRTCKIYNLASEYCYNFFINVCWTLLQMFLYV